MAGRPPKPSALKRLQGTDRADQRNGNEPEPNLLADLNPPAHLAPASAAVWRQLAPMLRRIGVLTEADVLALEMLCDSVADYRRARSQRGDEFVELSSKGNEVLKQLHVAMAMSSKRAEGLMASFGMSPAARSRVMVDPQGDLFGKPETNAQGTSRFFQH